MARARPGPQAGSTAAATACGTQLATVEAQMIKLRSRPAEAGTGPGNALHGVR
jgi:hypothetical protein